MKDWAAWHEAYDDPGSALLRRLRTVQRHIAAWLDGHPGDVRVVSACAGQGRDLLGVLAARPDAARVRARLVELDERNAAVAESASAGLSGVEVVRADAGRVASYVGAVPADLVLMCGVFGNVSDAGVAATVAALPELCAPGATVVWTRHRNPPDLTPAIRRWFEEAGFAEVAFDAPEGDAYAVGVAELRVAPRPPDATRTLFAFTR